MSPIRACVIGHPVAHSRSPLIHRHWLAVYGIDGDYGREDVPPENIKTFLEAFPRGKYTGANVTVPHKEAAYAMAKADAVAASLGAVNTLWHEDGKLFGTNTDAHGFLTNLDRSQPGWDADTETAVVLGAGGVARAVVYGLLQRGIPNIVVANRTRERAQQLAAHFDHELSAVALNDLPEHLAGTDLLVNATSLGMQGQPPLELDLALLKKTAPQMPIVYDLVYVPLETKLLADTRSRGLRTVDGLGMLLHQAAPAFERWFGVRPAVTPELRALVVADLQRETAR